MLSLSLRLSHTTMYTILITPTITLVKDPLMPSLNHGMDIVAMGDTGDANVVMLTLMLSLSLRLSHTTMHTILIIPTITLVKDPLMPSLSHGMDIEDMVDTGVANVAPLKLNHGIMEDMDTVDTWDKIKVDDGTKFPMK